jgi:hypothetical protein
MAHETKQSDDYAWIDYTPTYAGEHSLPGVVHYLNDGDYAIDGQTATFKTDWNGNMKQVVQQILWNRSAIKSVYECGCGGGWNIYTIQRVFPDLDCGGSDLVQSQIDHGKKHALAAGQTHAPGFHDRLRQIDMSDPGAPALVGRTYDLVFCQAVTMHLKDSRAVQFIQNMISISNRFVMMCENTAWQDYNRLFQLVQSSTPWRRTTTTGPFANGLFWLEKT